MLDKKTTLASWGHGPFDHPKSTYGHRHHDQDKLQEIVSLMPNQSRAEVVWHRCIRYKTIFCLWLRLLNSFDWGNLTGYKNVTMNIRTNKNKRKILKCKNLTNSRQVFR